MILDIVVVIEDQLRFYRRLGVPHHDCWLGWRFELHFQLQRLLLLGYHCAELLEVAQLMPACAAQIGGYAIIDRHLKRWQISVLI